MMAVQAYFAELIEEKRRNPADDLVSRAADLEHRRPAHPDARLAVLLPAHVHGRARHRVHPALAMPSGTWPATPTTAAVRRGPSLIPVAVEEFLRLFAFVAPARKVTRDADFHGVR